MMKCKKVNIFKIQVHLIYNISKFHLQRLKTIYKTHFKILKKFKVSIKIKIFRLAKDIIKNINKETPSINQQNIKAMRSLKSKKIKMSKVEIKIKRLQLN